MWGETAEIWGQDRYKPILPIISNPADPDSDNDGVMDNEDSDPLKKGIGGGFVGELSVVSYYNNSEVFSKVIHFWCIRVL